MVLVAPPVARHTAAMGWHAAVPGRFGLCCHPQPPATLIQDRGQRGVALPDAIRVDHSGRLNPLRCAPSRPTPPERRFTCSRTGPKLASMLVFASLITASAQADDEHASHQGSNAAPGALGVVHFPVTCSPDAQARFDRAMTLQHSFWYQQAAEAFRSVREID